MEKRIGIITIILILITLYSFVNFGHFTSNNTTLSNSYSYERCISMEKDGDYSISDMLIKQDICKNFDRLFSSYYIGMAFSFLFLTILSWRLDILKHNGKERNR